jgi:hypothetical protein
MANSATTEPFNICALDDDRTDEAPLFALLLRDIALAATLLGVALAADSWASSSDFVLAAGIAGVVGFAAAFGMYAPLHEWGHYLGAKLTGGRAPRNGLTRIFPMFHFDMDRSTCAQAAAVGIGGSAFTLLLALAIWTWPDGDSTGLLGMRLAMVYVMVSTAVIEWPIIIDTIRRGSGAAAWRAYLPKRSGRARLALVVGALATLAVYLLV